MYLQLLCVCMFVCLCVCAQKEKYLVNHSCFSPSVPLCSTYGPLQKHKKPQQFKTNHICIYIYVMLRFWLFHKTMFYAQVIKGRLWRFWPLAALRSNVYMQGSSACLYCTRRWHNTCSCCRFHIIPQQMSVGAMCQQMQHVEVDIRVQYKGLSLMVCYFLT